MQPKQVARLVPCGMIQLQPGYQSSNDLRLSCCTSIANDNSASNNSLGEFFFDQLFFPFLFSRTERTRFGWCGLLVEQRADQPKQVARLVPCGIVQLQPGCQFYSALVHSCWVSIADDNSATNIIRVELFFPMKLFFLLPTPYQYT
jgi:hypothetical protein